VGGRGWYILTRDISVLLSLLRFAAQRWLGIQILKRVGTCRLDCMTLD